MKAIDKCQQKSIIFLRHRVFFFCGFCRTEAIHSYFAVEIQNRIGFAADPNFFDADAMSLNIFVNLHNHVCVCVCLLRLLDDNQVSWLSSLAM